MTFAEGDAATKRVKFTFGIDVERQRDEKNLYGFIYLALSSISQKQYNFRRNKVRQVKIEII